jgi:hypothetical protein
MKYVLNEPIYELNKSDEYNRAKQSAAVIFPKDQPVFSRF